MPASLIGRPIIEETTSYMLLAPDVTDDPGFLLLRPKGIGNLPIWIVRVEKYLKLFGEPTNMLPELTAIRSFIVHNPNQWYSYEVKGGTVRVRLDSNEVLIHSAHPRKDEVVGDLMRLFRLTARTGRPAFV